MQAETEAESHLDQVRRAFDRIAHCMDEVVVRNPINAWMRRVNFAELRATFPPGSRLLELGCGTGEDAVGMAKRGCEVFAVDISPLMVAKAIAKAASAGLADRVVVARGRIADLNDVLQASPWRTFDGAYANFSLTYEAPLRATSEVLYRVLAPGSFFVCTLPNRVVLSEVLIYGPQLRFRNLLWRLQDHPSIDVHGVRLEFRAYSPRQVEDAMRATFELQDLVGIPVFLPPVYLHSAYNRLRPSGRLLNRLDLALARRYPWNRLGEHTLFKFRRRAE